MQDNDRTGLPDAEKLRELARWYREFAERAGSAAFGRRGCGWLKISNGRRIAWASAPSRAR
jgi:hypothetical protein